MAPRAKKAKAKTGRKTQPAGIVAGLGSRLKAARGDRSQEEVAHKAGVTPTTLNRYEKGKRYPGVIEFHKLCVVLGAEPGALLTGRSSRDGSTPRGEASTSGDSASTDTTALATSTALLLIAMPERTRSAFREIIATAAQAHLPEDAIRIIEAIAQSSSGFIATQGKQAEDLVGGLLSDPTIAQLLKSIEAESTA